MEIVLCNHQKNWKQADSNIDRKIDSQIDRQTCTKTDTHTHTDKHIQRHKRQVDSQPRQTDEEISGERDRQYSIII